MVLPPAGQVGYLTAGPQDAQRAARRMQPPSEAAEELLANGGVEPGSLVPPPVATEGAVAPEVETPVAEAPVDPAAAAPIAETESATTPAAVSTPAPVAEQPPSTSQASPAGGAVAGQG